MNGPRPDLLGVCEIFAKILGETLIDFGKRNPREAQYYFGLVGRCPSTQLNRAFIFQGEYEPNRTMRVAPREVLNGQGPSWLSWGSGATAETLDALRAGEHPFRVLKRVIDSTEPHSVGGPIQYASLDNGFRVFAVHDRTMHILHKRPHTGWFVSGQEVYQAPKAGAIHHFGFKLPAVSMFSEAQWPSPPAPNTGVKGTQGRP